MNIVKELRNTMGFKQSDLATRLDNQGSAISKYENKQLPLSSVVLKDLASIFWVSIDHILCRTNDPTPIRNADQDLTGEHNYDSELKAFMEDEEMHVMFHEYEDWTKEEKASLLQMLKGQKTLRAQNKKDD